MNDIIQLKNPKTELYHHCKEVVVDMNFPWFYSKITLSPDVQYDRSKYREISHLTHSLLVRPQTLSTFVGVQRGVDGKESRSTGHHYPIQRSEHLIPFERMMMEIFDYNDIRVGCFFRMCLNLVFPSGGIQLTIPHEDHFYPHKNVIVYLTNSGGSTFVEGQEHDPIEDDVITFEGEHYHKLPERDPRIVLVATYTGM